MHFTGRFQITSIHTTKALVENKETNTAEMRRAVQATFSPVYGGTPADDAFHRFTPAGKLELTITNPDVAEILDDLWRAWVLSEQTDWNGQPKFEATFRLVDPETDQAQ